MGQQAEQPEMWSEVYLDSGPGRMVRCDNLDGAAQHNLDPKSCVSAVLFPILITARSSTCYMLPTRGSLALQVIVCLDAVRDIDRCPTSCISLSRSACMPVVWAGPT